jgi:hypothetical protein
MYESPLLVKGTQKKAQRHETNQSRDVYPLQPGFQEKRAKDRDSNQ